LPGVQADMQEVLRLLRGLQELDEELFRVNAELRRLPEERTRRRANIDLEVQRRDELRRQIHELRSRIKEIEDMTSIQRQRMRKLESEAAGSRGDPSLLMSFQHAIKTLRRDIGEAEEEGLGLVDEAERLEAQAGEREQAIASLEEDFRDYGENVEREVRAAEAKRDRLVEERNARLRGAVPPEVLGQYEKLLEAREGQAVAQLDGRVCQGCYVGVPNNVYVRLARGTELVHCPSCNRILYLP
jgi:hypothetical protein